MKLGDTEWRCRDGRDDGGPWWAQGQGSIGRFNLFLSSTLVADSIPRILVPS